MSQIRSIVVAVIGVAVVAHSTASAQPGPLAAAVQYVQRSLLAKHISVDPRILPVPLANPFGMVPCRTEQPPPLPAVANCAGLVDTARLTIDSQRHPDSALAELQGDTLITVMSRERAAVCGGPWKAECKTTGPEHFVMVSAPVVRGDSAFMHVQLQVLNSPTASDSATVCKSAVRTVEILHRCLKFGGGSTAKMILVRSGAAWRVLAYTIVSQT